MNKLGKNSWEDVSSLCWLCVRVNVCDQKSCLRKFRESKLFRGKVITARCNKFQAYLSNNNDLLEILDVTKRQFERLSGKEINEILKPWGLQAFKDDDPELSSTKWGIRVMGERNDD